jgi:hypothetical protein
MVLEFGARIYRRETETCANRLLIHYAKLTTDSDSGGALYPTGIDIEKNPT